MNSYFNLFNGSCSYKQYKHLIMQKFTYILIALIIYSCNSKKKDTEHVQFQRHIELEGQPNFRDLGNYTTRAGDTLKTGVLYRSGTLSKATENDVSILKDLGIKTVVNFLTDEEIEKRGNDNLPSGVKSIFIPISGDNDEASTVLEARNTGDFTNVPTAFNFNIHKLLTEVGKASYAQFFKTLADSTNYPIVFHCSHGIHRTGTAASLVLSLLDVPWNQIEADYMLSNKYRSEENEARIKQLDSLSRIKNDTLNYAKNIQNIEAFYLLKEDYILGTKNEIEENYTSFNNYLLSMGLSKEELIKIKKNLMK